MAAKKVVKPRAAKQQAQLAKPKPSGLSWIIPVVIIVAVAIVAYQKGYFNFGDSHVYEILPSATRNVPCAYNFSELIPLLIANGGSAQPPIYTFYLGSGVGFPPMGLILGIDGVLKGTPTGKGSKFQVCVKDVGGKSFCRTYHLNVNDANDDNDNNVTPSSCPTKFNPACHTVTGGISMEGGPVPINCPCPSGSHDSGAVDNTAPGGPYKICLCD